MSVEASHSNEAEGRRSGGPRLAGCARGDLQGTRGVLRTRRIARLSAETGARFVRERIFTDPVTWLFTPKELFGGRTPIDACASHSGFAAAMMLHEYSLGLDCSPASLIDLPRTMELQFGIAEGASCRLEHAGDRDGEPPRLFTFVIVQDVHEGQVQIFGAMIARDAVEVRSRLRQRVGPLMEGDAVLREGFDWSEPMACAMVSEAMADILMLASADPTSPIALGLDFQVEQRFAN